MVTTLSEERKETQHCAKNRFLVGIFPKALVHLQIQNEADQCDKI